MSTTFAGRVEDEHILTGAGAYSADFDLPGQVWLEHALYDPASGQLLSGSFMDYAMPRADDLPASM
jgi:hypothetical protein